MYKTLAANKLYIKFANKVMMESDQFTGITVLKLSECTVKFLTLLP